jgi:hypothetical protein
MRQEKVKSVTISLYPSQKSKVERIMRALKIRKFAQGVQRLIDEAPEPQPLEDHGQTIMASRP